MKTVLAIVLAAALLAALPAVAGAGLEVQNAVLAGSSVIEGPLAMGHVEGPLGTLQVLTLDAGHVDATQYDVVRTAVELPDGTYVFDETLARATGNPPTSMSWSSDEVHGDLVMQTTAAVVHVYGTPSIHWVADNAEAGSLQGPTLLPSGIGDGGATSDDGDPAHLRYVHADGRHTLLTSEDGLTDSLLTGTFTLEFTGADLDLSGAAGSTSLHSGETWNMFAPGVSRVDTSIIRLEVRDGAALVRFLGIGTATQYASRNPVSTAMTEGTMHLTGASGTLDAAGRSIVAQDGRVDLGAPISLDLFPSGDGIGIGAQGEPAPQAVTNNPLVSTSAGLLWVAIPIGLVVAIVVAVVLNRSRRHSIAAIEAALAAGRNDEAADLAAQQLKADPSQEDAAIARAVALRKTGRSQQVVAEVSARLQHHAPSDGVLHYLLGLALMDLGQDAQARAAWQEAVRRTPSLAREVAARLGPEPTPRDAGAYA